VVDHRLMRNCPKNYLALMAQPEFASHLLESSGLNFINILRTAFMLVDPESIKNTVKS